MASIASEIAEPHGETAHSAPPFAIPDFDIVPRAGLVFAGIILVALIVVVATGGLWALEFMHVVFGAGWTCRSVPRVHHRADPRQTLDPRAHRVHDKFMPKMVVLMPAIVTATLVAGWQLSTQLGTNQTTNPSMAGWWPA